MDRSTVDSSAGAVRAWREPVTIPTYGVDQPDRNPMFLEKRVYQGSSGAVYPHPVIDRVFDEKQDREWVGLFLENRYLKVLILPELGGRVQMALDKTNGYHFIYYNRVIKPALVGLTGPWISGGIEFNWPQHHRPSTFDPVDFRIEEHTDGSRTIWCSEIERMFRTRGMVGFTLHPDRAYLELRVQLSNRTSEPQTFLWWANPAVHVNDDYRSVFPPDVHAVMDHGKRDVSDFPIATGTYYKVDYSPGTDISRYRNIPVPTSYMAAHSDFDFLGCYDHGREAGMMHVANHHIVPGKKQWTWGNGDFGRAWDRQLTDEDGPYIEVMCGAYTDNQPDFSWLMPGEEKRFTQVFMPYKGIGGAKNANRDAVINLDVGDDRVELGAYVTRPRAVEVRLLHGEDRLVEDTVSLSPENAYTNTIRLGDAVRPQELTLELWSDGRKLIDYTPLSEEQPEIPAPQTAAPPPREVASNEELFFHGLHLEQYRHATFRPEPYYEEALRRDPGDSRCNNALGLLLYRYGRFTEAEAYFRRAVERITQRNPNPYDGEPFYNLGLALRMQGRYDEAFGAFYKAVWNDAWQAAGYFELARIACRRRELEDALELAEKALVKNRHHHRARHLKIAILRRLDRAEEAVAEANLSLELDAVEHGARYERNLLMEDPEFDRLIGGRVHTYIELALDYGHAGFYSEAVGLLNEAPDADPMVRYYAGWFELQRGNHEAAHDLFAVASAMPPDYCFPNRIECVPALQAAATLREEDPRAPYYLGNFWYAHRQYEEAIAAWERSRDLDPHFPTVHRNLGLAYMDKRQDPEAALRMYERALELDPSDSRVFFELDQLRKKRGEAPAARLTRLERRPRLVEERDDLTIEYVTLLNIVGEHERALDLLLVRTFHPWEGGEGKTTRQYVISLIELARRALADGEPARAIDLLTRARSYPPNLGEGKLSVAQENDLFFHLGRAHAAMGDAAEARAWFERASSGPSEPTSAMYYNDQPPDMIYYQGLARRELGQSDEAKDVFRRLVDYGERHLDDDVGIDYFAVSLPDFLLFDDDPSHLNRVHCHYVAGLGWLGLGETAKARRELERVLELAPAHQGAHTHVELDRG